MMIMGEKSKPKFKRKQPNDSETLVLLRINQEDPLFIKPASWATIPQAFIANNNSSIIHTAGKGGVQKQFESKSTTVALWRSCTHATDVKRTRKMVLHCYRYLYAPLSKYCM